MAEVVGRVATIGYQGKSIQQLVAELLAAQIDVLIDVRRLPLSRKPGFSKTALREHLKTAGIRYEHYPDLGMPRDLLKLKNHRDNSPILSEYEALLPTLTDEVEVVERHAQDQRICLLCFEADHDQCHRGVLADFMNQRTDCAVDHL